MYKKLKRERTVALSFHLPAMIILLIITFIPLLLNIKQSLFDFKLASPGSVDDFIGFKNYVTIFHDVRFYKSLGITFIFVLAATIFEFLLGAVIAGLLDQVTVGRKILSALWIVPMTIAPLVVGLMFSFILNPQFGLYGFFLDVTGSSLSRAPLSSSVSAMIALIITDIWQWTPYMILMLFAGLKTLPSEPYEAADIDGVSGFQKLRYITFPMMKPVITVSLILRGVEAFKVFDKPYLLTGGGPGSATEVIDLYTYRKAFVDFHFSYASALCLILFVLLLCFGILYWFFFMRRQYEI